LPGTFIALSFYEMIRCIVPQTRSQVFKLPRRSIQEESGGEIARLARVILSQKVYLDLLRQSN
jgi:hypothetical protein